MMVLSSAMSPVLSMIAPSTGPRSDRSPTAERAGGVAVVVTVTRCTTAVRENAHRQLVRLQACGGTSNDEGVFRDQRSARDVVRGGRAGGRRLLPRRARVSARRGRRRLADLPAAA